MQLPLHKQPCSQSASVRSTEHCVTLGRAVAYHQQHCLGVQLLSGNTNAVASLRRKYTKLLGVALTLQNLLDDVATQLERLHACITWQDPSATLLFIAFCACAAMALALLGLPTVLAVGCFWVVRLLLQKGSVFQLTGLSLHGLSCLKTVI